MVTDTPTPASACTGLCRPPRHIHPAAALDAMGVPCAHGHCSWWLAWGGPLPAAVVCRTCLNQGPLEQLLRTVGRGNGR